MRAAQLLSTEVPVEIRQAAAVNFKNFVKYRWVRLALKASEAGCHGSSSPSLAWPQVPRDDDLFPDQVTVQEPEKVRLL